MSTLPTGFATPTVPSFLPSTGGLVSGLIAQRNAGSVMNLTLTTPIVIGAPFAPGGTAAFANVSLQPIGAAPHAQVALRLNFYDSTGALIGTQDIV